MNPARIVRHGRRRRPGFHRRLPGLGGDRAARQRRHGAGRRSWWNRTANRSSISKAASCAMSMVHDGQIVAAGQLLVQLDDTQARASLDLIRRARPMRWLRKKHGSTPSATAPTTSPSRQICWRARTIPRSRAGHPRRAEHLRHAARHARQADAISSTSATARTSSIIAGLRSEQTAIEQQSALIDQEPPSVQELYDKGLSTLPRLLAVAAPGGRPVRPARPDRREDRADGLNSGENQLQIINLRNQHMSDVVKDLRDVQTKRFDLLDRIHAARDVLARLTHPRAGVRQGRRSRRAHRRRRRASPATR